MEHKTEFNYKYTLPFPHHKRD